MRTGVPTEFDSSTLTIFQAVELLFDSGTVRLWDGIGDFILGGNTYAGAGSFLSISQIHENSEISAKGITVTLSSVDPTILSYAMTEHYQYRRINIHVGAISGSTISSYLAFSGRMDIMTDHDTGDTLTMQLTAESRLIDLKRPRVHRWTSEDQKAMYPGDTCFDSLNSLQDKKILWGA